MDVIVQLLKYGLVIGLVVAWASILLPPVVRFVGGRVGRGTDSIGSFRSQLSSLGGRSARTHGPVVDLTGRAPAVSAPRPVPATTRVALPRVSARKRRRDILTGLLATTGLLLLAGVVVGGVAWYLFGLSGLLLVAYVGLLWSMQQAHLERQRKVAYLPQQQAPGRPGDTLRPVGSGRV